jgi:ligand-binding sensor domain-containing protein
MLWVGTRGGLLFGHDGKVWTQYDARTDPLAAWPAITALGLDDDGALLAGTSWGLGRLEGTGLQRVAGLPGQMAQPYAIGRDAAGRLWLAGSSAVAVRQEGSWRVISSASSGLPSDGGLSLAPDNSGGMWLGASGWVAHWISGEWTVLKDSTLADGVSAMLVERSGSVWAGTRGRGVRILSDNGWRQVALATSGLPCERVSRMIEDVHRAIWFATPAGLTRWQAGEWMVFSELDPGLPNLGALTVFGRVDSEVVWVATGANRILRYDGTNWQALDWSASNISGSPITTLYEDRSAWLWVGTEAAGVAVYQSGAWRTYDKEQSGLSSNRVSGFAEDSNGRVWIGLLTDASGSPGGIARFDGASLEMFPSVHDNVLSVAIDGHDVLWVGTGNASGPAYPGGGLGRYDGTGWSFLGPDNSELPFNYVTAVRPAPDGTLWVGAYDGVARHDGASWQAWTPASSKLSDDNIFDILVDDRGNAWIATGNDGVNVFNSGGVRLP